MKTEEDGSVLRMCITSKRYFTVQCPCMMVRTFTCSFAVACSEDYLLQFPTRYLEWIMIAREVSLDPTFSLSSGARADALTEAERDTILSVRRM